MARLLRPVTNTISVMPAAAASSTAYWMSGLSTIGSISFGLALVTGRKRLPSPATGNTAFLSFLCMSEILQQIEEFLLAEHRHAEAARALELAAGVPAGDHVVGALRHRAAHLVAFRLDGSLRLVARHARQGTSQHESLAGAMRAPRRRLAFLPPNAGSL